MKFDNLLLSAAIICLVYIGVVEFWLIDVYNPYLFLVRAGQIFLKFSYSIVASSIFYFIIIYLPKRRRWTSIVAGHTYVQVKSINNEVSMLQMAVGIGENEIRNRERIYEVLNKTSATDEWYLDIQNRIRKLLNHIQVLRRYDDFLDNKIYQELILIELNVLKIDFSFSVMHPTAYTTPLMEIFYHNARLKSRREFLEIRDKALLEKADKKYRAADDNPIS